MSGTEQDCEKSSYEKEKEWYVMRVGTNYVYKIEWIYHSILFISVLLELLK